MSDVSKQAVLGLALQFGLIAGPFMSMVDSNAVNVAIPVMVADFHAPLSTVQWVLSGYLLALGAVLVSSAYLSKRYGAGRVYFVSILGFTGASALCAVSPTLWFLIFARVLQGTMGALLVPLAMDMLLGKGGGPKQISPMFGLILFLAPALGPTLGGALIGVAGWPSVFLINVPFGLFAAYVVKRDLKPQRDGASEAPTFDLVGSVILASGIVLGLYGATEGPLQGWTSAQSLPYWALGAALLPAYAVWEARRRHPAVNLALLKRGQTALALGISNIANVVLFAILVLLPVFTESAQGASAFITGLVLLPQGVVTGIGILVGQKMYEKTSVRLVTLVGFAILSITTAMLVLVDVNTSLWAVAVILSGRGLALGLTIQPLLLTTIGDLSGDDVPDGNTLFNVMERVFSSVGISLLSTYFQLREETYSTTLTAFPQAATSAFHDAILVLTVLSLVGLGLALLLKSKTPVNEQLLSRGAHG